MSDSRRLCAGRLHHRSLVPPDPSDGILLPVARPTHLVLQAWRPPGVAAVGRSADSVQMAVPLEPAESTAMLYEE